MQDGSTGARPRRSEAVQRGCVTAVEYTIRTLVERMLGMVEPDSYRIEEGDGALRVAIAGTEIMFTSSAAPDLACERLASAIESRIAFERARAMLGAAGETGTPPPLWLVTGSDALARWLTWSGAANALRRSVTLTDRLGAAPVSGLLDRRARRELGQGGARIRVWSAEAVAERIELAVSPVTTMALGIQAHIRVARAALPETLIGGLVDMPGKNDSRRVADIVGHAFVADADLRLGGVRNDVGGVVVDIKTGWRPLAPIPAEARAAVPRDADPAAPWKPTAREMRALDRLVDEGRRCRPD